jgi:hypothetical protein
LRIVINKCYGGFGLSPKAVMEYAKLKGITLYPHEDGLTTHYTTIPWEEYKKLEEGDTEKPIKPGRFNNSNSYYFSPRNIPRDDPALIQVVGTLGEDSYGFAADLQIVKIPDGIEWEVEEYDGLEWIAEKHRTWR